MKSKKTELEKRLFGPKGDNFRPLRKSQVQQFLRLSAEGRKEFFQYTDLNAVIGMLNSRELWLTRGSDLNDLREFANSPEKAKRTFVASFCRTIQEDVGMWRQYGLRGNPTRNRIPVRVKFLGNELRNAVAGKRQARIVGQKRVAVVEEPVWCDVIYQLSRGGSSGLVPTPAQCTIIFDRKIANGTRCKAFMNAVEEFPAYAKDECWAYEGETRLTIELSENENAKGIRQIAIPIAEPLLNIEVCIGPGELAKEYRKAVEERLTQEGFTISGSKSKGGRFAVRIEKGVDLQGRAFAYPQRVKLVDSRCAVRFAGWKT